MQHRVGPKVILFDLDGTLLDTAPDLAAAVNRVRQDQGLKPLPYETIRPHVSNGTLALTIIGSEAAPETDEFEDFRARFLEAYAADVATLTQPFDGISTLLEQLESEQRRWGIVTNKPSHFTVPIVNALGYASRAACVISGDTATHAKPHPAPLLLAAKQINIAPAECAYVGDAKRDIEAGKAAGMMTIAATYGYLEHGEDPKHWNADLLVDSPHALADCLRQRSNADG